MYARSALTKAKDRRGSREGPCSSFLQALASQDSQSVQSLQLCLTL